MTVSDISRDLGFAKSTVHDIISTLESQGIVVKDPELLTYGLGWRLFELGRMAQENMELRKIARGPLERLHRILDETVHLTVLDNGEVLYVDVFESSKRLRTYSVIGVRAPMHCTSVGKAMMAYMDDAQIDRVIDQYGMARFTDRTITDRALLGEELRRVRSQGYAVDDIEHEPGVRCVGAAIHDHAGAVFASISISGPTARITSNRVTELGKLARETADEVSSRLGYRKDGASSSANQQTRANSGSPAVTSAQVAGGEDQEQT